MNMDMRMNFNNMKKQLRAKAEHFLFWLVEKTPERLIPAFVMEWTERYTQRRIEEMKQQIVRQKWNMVELEQIVEKIHETEKAPAEH